MKFLSAIFLLIIVATSAICQSDNATEREWLLDIPSCPVRIGINSGNNSVILINSSAVTVSEIRLGIVTNNQGKYKIVSKRSFVKTEIKKDLGVIYTLKSLAKDVQLSLKKKGKLAIISVKFSDGSSWQAASGSN